MAMSEMAGFDAAEQWRRQQAADEAQFISGLAARNPHSMDMNLPLSLEEDGAA
jgi:hypothetical protein